ncbi:MAG: lysine transporter LysE [Flavobacteriaceae bacterium]|nr:MAG: lysine transporter LysE [Flavobacteriaceae bacterium]
MSVILPFLSGFVAAIIGIFPPGLINMTAAKVSVTDGRRRALVFVLGALLVILIQTYISVIFAQYINKNQDIVVLLREIGLAIFTVISIYFLFFAKKTKPQLDKKNIQLKSKKSRFFMGMLISAINFFPIPYYVLVTITLASYKLFVFQSMSIYSFVFGVVIGSFSCFYCYVVFFEKLKAKTDYFVRNMNTIIGIITGLVAILTLINVLNYYFQ